MLQNIDFKKDILPHIGAILFFLVLTFIYCHPVLDGKQIKSQDSNQAKANQKHLRDFQERTGDFALWTNSIFSGMPTFQVWLPYPGYLVRYVSHTITLGMDTPTRQIFLYFLGFYILSLTMGFKFWLSVVSAVAFGLSSYNIVILEAMHVTKGVAIGYMAPVLAGVILCFRKKYLLGAGVLALFAGVELQPGHYQITYYLLLMCVILAITEFISYHKNKDYKNYTWALAIIFMAGTIGVLPKTGQLWSTYEYGQESIRGKKSQIKSQDNNSKEGLGKDYATRWSYGKMETFTLLIPNFMGGSSTASLGKDSETYQTMINKGVPPQRVQRFTQRMNMYWGPQSFTSGPVYFGAVVCFLFFFAVLIIKHRLKWWLISAASLSIMLAWGKHFEAFFDLFFNYLPLFNKFRAPSMTLVIASVCFPLLGIWGVRKFLDTSKEKEKRYLFNRLKQAFYVTGGLCLFFAVLGPSFLDFTSRGDARLQQAAGQWLVDAVREDRESWLRYDAFRSLAFISVCFTAFYFWYKKKLNKKALIIIIGGIILVDLWTVDKRYLSEDDFVEEESFEKPFRPNRADQSILQDNNYSSYAQMNFQSNFRVFNLSRDPFNDARTSYFHKSIGGYHAAKLRKYQDFIEYHLSELYKKAVRIQKQKGTKQATSFLSRQPVINMLNTKYFIFRKNRNTVAQKNPNRMGNAWFVDSIKFVNTPRQEISQLNQLNLDRIAVMLNKYRDNNNFKSLTESTNEDYIKLDSYSPNQLEYSVNTSGKRLTVFSEIYYNNNKGWNAYIDGEKHPLLQVNYILRGLVVPPGEHTITFKFEPPSYYIGNKIAYGASFLLFIFVLGNFSYYFVRNFK